jgi:hypothetical protein
LLESLELLPEGGEFVVLAGEGLAQEDDLEAVVGLLLGLG